MKMSGVAPTKGGRKKAQRTRVRPCTHPSWTENILENEERGETTDTHNKRGKKEEKNKEQVTSTSDKRRCRWYQSWSSRPNTRWKALNEIYKFHKLLAALIFKSSQDFQHTSIVILTKNFARRSSKLRQFVIVGEESVFV
mgnify:CR=1 FL=1